MNLEEILQQKVVAKAEAEQKTRAEAEAAEVQRVEQEELLATQENQKNLAEQMATVDTQISETETLLAQLEEAQSAARASLEPRSKLLKTQEQAGQDLAGVFENEAFKAVLEAEGIKSVDDLLASEDYQPVKQVKDFTESSEALTANKNLVKAEVAERGATKDAARKVLQEEHPNISRTYTEIHGGLQDRLDSLRSERQELFSQTPEGVRERDTAARELMSSKLAAEFRQLGYTQNPHKFAEAIQFVGKTVTEAEKAMFGEEVLRAHQEQLIRETLDQQTEKSFYDKNPEFKVQQNALEQIEELSEKFEALRTTTESLSRKERALREALGKLFDSKVNPDAEKFIATASKILEINTTNEAQVVNTLLQRKTEVVGWDFRGHQNEYFGDVRDAMSFREYLHKVLDEVSINPHTVRARVLEKMKDSTKGKIPNPEILLSLAMQQEQNLDTLLETLATIGDGQDQQSLITAANAVFGHKREVTQVRHAVLETPSREVARVLPGSVNELNQAVSLGNEKLEAQKGEAFKAVVNASEDLEAIENFNEIMRNHEQRSQISNVEKTYATWEHVGRIVAQLRETERLFRPDEAFESDGRKVYPFGWEKKRNDLNQIRQNLNIEIESLRENVTEERERSLGMDLLGSKKKAQTQILTNLEADITNKKNELKQEDSNLAALFRDDKKYIQLNEILDQLRDKNVLVPVEAGLSASELFSQIKALPDALACTPENLEILKTFKASEAKASAARRKITDAPYRY